MTLVITNAVSLEQQWHKPYINVSFYKFVKLCNSEYSLNLYLNLNNNKDNTDEKKHKLSNIAM